MDRNEFITKLSLGIAIACTANCFSGCSKDDDIPTPQNVDFTLDLSQSKNAALNSVGESVYMDGVIIARINTNEFAAVSQACTHQGTTVVYENSNTRFHCPNHGSNFDTSGKVNNGPASSSLKKYNTTLNGTLLRVFS